MWRSGQEGARAQWAQARPDEAARQRAREVAEALDERLELRARCAPWAAHAYDPAGPRGPVLHIDDLNAIPFLQDIIGVELYQLRAVVRAGDGDLTVATCPPIEDYKAYNRDRLGLGAPESIHAPQVATAAEVALAASQGPALERLAEVARAKGGLLIHPYMGSEPVWELARAIHEASGGAPVRVLGPPPPVTWLANDKELLTEAAREAAGADTVVPTTVGHGPREIARQLRALAEAGHRRVALKKTRCASAMGNRRFLSSELLTWDEDVLLAEVERFLLDKEWSRGEPILSLVWEDVTSSPSTQLWIPHPSEGRPRVDGVYEQLLEGPEQVFLGSIPSRLGPEVEARLAEVSLKVAEVYQAFGYVGRCSFDFIVREGGGVRFVECNGRWGGTSTPMHLIDRLFPEGRPWYRARDFISEELKGVSFSELAARLGDALYDPRSGEGRFVLYNMGMLSTYGKLDVISLGRDVDDATEALEVELPRLLGLA